ncbi:hypothetical protein BH18ACT15_BH18ACT15_11910 [soil metagenome]
MSSDMSAEEARRLLELHGTVVNVDEIDSITDADGMPNAIRVDRSTAMYNVPREQRAEARRVLGLEPEDDDE